MPHPFGRKRDLSFFDRPAVVISVLESIEHQLQDMKFQLTQIVEEA